MRHIVFFLLFFSLSQAHAATPEQCDHVRQAIANYIDKGSKELITPVQDMIDRLNANGLDPSHYFSPERNIWINYYQALEQAQALRNQAYEKLVTQHVPHDCMTLNSHKMSLQWQLFSSCQSR